MGSLTVTTIKANTVTKEGAGSVSTGYNSAAMYQTNLTANSNPNDTGGFTLRTVFNQTPIINQSETGAWTNDGTFITIPISGLYIVIASTAYNNAAARDSPRFRFRINSNGQFEESQSSYIRVASGHNEASTELVTAYNLNAGDTVAMEFGQAGNNGQSTTIIAGDSYITIWRIG